LSNIEPQGTAKKCITSTREEQRTGKITGVETISTNKGDTASPRTTGGLHIDKEKDKQDQEKIELMV
jgi:hypothetical protein